MNTGIELITQERKEQIEKHGRTLEYDLNHNKFLQLSEAAILLAHNEYHHLLYDIPTPYLWNKSLFDKMLKKPYKERLIIAGALIAAELDRINNDDKNHFEDFGTKTLHV